MANKSGNTVRLHRVLSASPEKVYRAFTEAAALTSWLPPYGFVAETHEMDARVGGGYRMSFINFTTGKRESFAVKYLELVPHELIRHTDQFDDPNLPGVMEVTIKLKAVLPGTELHIEQSGIPEAIPLEFCYMGWQDSLDKLARLVQPEIPDGPAPE